MNIDYFTNDKYKVLRCMAERQIEVAGFVYAPLSQRQVANITGIAFGTVNTIIKYLKKMDILNIMEQQQEVNIL